MAIELPALPYAYDALEPWVSSKTLTFHHDKHHKNYVEKTNQLIKSTAFESMDLKDIVAASYGTHESLFNNSAQAWNHNFLWQCMSAPLSSEPGSSTLQKIAIEFGSPENMKAQFTEKAKKLFGSGWTWLLQNSDGRLAIENYKNADTPIVHDQIPLLTCDVWEHAYYLDYQNDREKYLENFWKVANWTFIESILQQKAPDTNLSL